MLIDPSTTSFPQGGPDFCPCEDPPSARASPCCSAAPLGTTHPPAHPPTHLHPPTTAIIRLTTTTTTTTTASLHKHQQATEDHAPLCADDSASCADDAAELEAACLRGERR